MIKISEGLVISTNKPLKCIKTKSLQKAYIINTISPNLEDRWILLRRIHKYLVKIKIFFKGNSQLLKTLLSSRVTMRTINHPITITKLCSSNNKMTTTKIEIISILILITHRNSSKLSIINNKDKPMTLAEKSLPLNLFNSNR